MNQPIPPNGAALLSRNLIPNGTNLKLFEVFSYFIIFVLLKRHVRVHVLVIGQYKDSIIPFHLIHDILYLVTIKKCNYAN